MASVKYPNIVALNDLYIKHKIAIQVSKSNLLCEREDYREINMVIGDKSFTFFVDDEYEDFRYNYPLLNFCVTLRELEDYKFSDDYLLWCTERNFEASNMKLRDYYMSLDKIYNEIEAILGGINSYIPSMDFEFSMGEVHVLREENW